MKVLALLALTVMTIVPHVANAHPGHVSEVSGHNHWIAHVAIAAATFIGTAWLVGQFRLKGSRRSRATTKQANGRQS